MHLDVVLHLLILYLNFSSSAGFHFLYLRGEEWHIQTKGNDDQRAYSKASKERMPQQCQTRLLQLSYSKHVELLA
jgi:hypothetical protein